MSNPISSTELSVANPSPVGGESRKLNSGEGNPTQGTSPAPVVPGSTLVASSIEAPPLLESRDVTMVDGAVELAASQSPAPGPVNATALNSAASPLHTTMRNSTPVRLANLNNSDRERDNSTSRAASALPEPGFTMPSEAPNHGAPVRQYLNSKVTGPLLEGVKLIAKEKPNDPLRVLGEYLIRRSQELEGSSNQINLTEAAGDEIASREGR